MASLRTWQVSMVVILLAGCSTGDVTSPVSDAASSFDGGDGAADANEFPPPQPTHDARDTEPRPADAGAADAAMPVDAGSPDSGVTRPPPEPPPPPKPLVVFDPPGSGFTSPFMLKLTAGEAAAALHYTTDGSVPTSASKIVENGTIVITTTTQVRVVAIRDGVSSPVFNQSYFELDASVQSFNSNLPVIVVHTLGGPAPQAQSREYIPAMFGMFQRANERTTLSGNAQHTSRTGIKIRGRSTRMAEKPSYTLELWGRVQEDAPASLAGMPMDGDWVLYAPFDWDRSMMHNVFSYDLSRKIGRYAPRTQYCEVFLVTSSAKVTMANYVGVYVLTERLTRSPDRVAIDKLEPTHTTDPLRGGGYIVKVDEPDEPEELFMAAGLKFIYVEPDVDEITTEQKQYIADYLNACKRAVSATDGKDPMTGTHYSALLDVPSFIDHHILSLLLKNPDAFALSSYFYKARDGKLFAGPIWDFDLAMAAIDPWGNRSMNPLYWGPNNNATMFRRSFWNQLFNHAEFVSAYWARLDELLASTFTSANFRATVDAFEAQVTEAEARNRARWPESAPRSGSYVEEIDAMQTWLDARLSWVTANKGTVPPP